METHYYDILGIQASADSAIVQSAYRRKALKFHPDRSNSNESLSEFQLISEAYHVLSNKEWKAVYDRYGMDVLKHGLKQNDGGCVGGCYAFDPLIDPDQIFQRFFATSNPYEAIHNEAKKDEFGEIASYRPQKIGADKIIEFYCILEEVFYGCTKTVVHTKTIREADDSIVEQKREIQITIAPGTQDGTTYFFAKEGDVEPNVTPGDVTFVLKTRPHDRFSREGRDLVVFVTLPLHHAFIHSPIEVETLDGRILSVVLPCIPTPGYRHIVKSEGMSFPDRTHGDLVIEISLQFQKELTPTQKELLHTAFLFPSVPSEAQMKAAKDFIACGKANTHGWLHGRWMK